jgi:hypothetical protein
MPATALILALLHRLSSSPTDICWKPSTKHSVTSVSMSEIARVTQRHVVRAKLDKKQAVLRSKIGKHDREILTKVGRNCVRLVFVRSPLSPRSIRARICAA